jgi:hypothetical protein
MSFGDKEIRNIEIEKVMIECKSKCYNTLKAVFGSVDDRELTDIVNENMKSIFNGKLKSVRFTGTPENVKEIEDLTCNWDYSEIVFLSVDPKTHCFSKEMTCNSDFALSIFEFIEVGDCIKEYCNPLNLKEKALIVEINPSNYRGNRNIFKDKIRGNI